MEFGNEFTGCYLYLLSYVKNDLLEKLFQRVVSLTTNINNKLNLLYIFFFCYSVCASSCGVWLPLGVKGCKSVRGHPHTLKGKPHTTPQFDAHTEE